MVAQALESLLKPMHGAILVEHLADALGCGGRDGGLSPPALARRVNRRT
jgi:hypothetical protein